MKRQTFIRFLGTVILWPLAVRAQQLSLPVVGYLSSGLQRLSAERLRMFQEGLNQAGYRDGRDISIEYRWAEGQYDRLPALAADLVARDVKVIIVPDSVVTAKAAKAATSKIPIVFGIGADPINAGLVSSLSHPGGNLTGASRLNVELEPKRLELLHELVPKAHVFGLLVNPGNPNAAPSAKDSAAAAHSLGVSLHVLHASSNRDIDFVFAELAVLGIEGLLIAPDPFFLACSRQLAELALRYRIPSIFEYREFAAYGGLASYAGNPMEGYRLIGLYVARILKGEKPADLPVQQYAKIELIVNLKTASFLGIDVPPSILFRADEIIENEPMLSEVPEQL